MRRAAAVMLLVLLGAAAGCGGSEARKARALERGQEFFAERDYAKARVEFRNALQIDPKDAQARALLGETSEALGDFEEAVNNYRYALALDENQVKARARLGRMMVFGGVPDQALETIAPGLEKNPQSADLLAVRAAVHLQQGEVDAARKDAEAALAAQPNQSDATALLATLLWREDKRDEALAMLDKTIKASPDDIVLRQIYAQLLLTAERPGPAEAQLKEIIRLEPEVQGHRYRLAQLQAAQKNTDAAVATLRDAVKAKPEDVEAKLALANLLVAQRSFEAAEQELLGFAKAAPRDLELKLGIGRFYELNGRPEDAERIYREVMKEAGDKAQGVTARTRIASVMIRSGKTEEASKLLEEVLARNPSDTEALVMRAQLAIGRGNADAAITDLRTALRDQPTNILLIAQLAQAYIRSDNVALAEQTLRQAVQANPRDVQTRLALAQFLVNKGEAEKARPVLEQLVKDAPNNVEAVEANARLLLLVNDPAAALQAATTVQTLQPKSPSGYLLAGAAQAAQQRPDEARKSFEAALAADPKSLDALVALAQLDLATGNAAQALGRLDARIAAQPNDARLHHLRGELLMALRRPDDALASYAQAARLQPAWPPPYRGQAAVLIAQGQQARAAEVLKGALGPTGNAVDIAVDLGSLYALQGKHDDAIAVYERQLERDANSLVAANNLAMLLATYRTDAASLERAEQLSARLAGSDTAAKVPQSQELRYHLGMAQLKAGKTAEARKNLAEAIKAGQAFPGIEEAKSALAGL